jgi:hypothetical protein
LDSPSFCDSLQMAYLSPTLVPSTTLTEANDQKSLAKRVSSLRAHVGVRVAEPTPVPRISSIMFLLKMCIVEFLHDICLRTVLLCLLLRKTLNAGLCKNYISKFHYVVFTVHFYLIIC